MKEKSKTIFADILFYLVGAFIYAFAVTAFIAPNHISPGGFTGIATLVNYLSGFPSGLILLLLNIPILLLGFVKFGGVFVIKTAVATVFCSVALTVTDYIVPTFITDSILASVFGGALMGLGLSIILRRGATTGGIDIIAKIINKKYRHLTVGKIMLLIDSIVIILAMLVYKNIESALYSVISIFAATKVMDIILYGADMGKMIYVITKKHQDICREINYQLKRGVTIINAVGGYTGKESKLIICTVMIHEVSAVYNVIKKYDNSAFIVVCDAGEIIGEGFKLNR